MSQKVIDFLLQHDIEYKLYEHPPVYTVEEALQTRKFISGMHLKNLFIKDSRAGNYYLLVAQADTKVDLKSIKTQIGARKLSMAKREELEQILQVEPGSVSFFNLLNTNSVTFVLYEEVYNADLLTFHPNDNTKTLEFNNSEFHRLLELISPDFLIVN